VPLAAAPAEGERQPEDVGAAGRQADRPGQPGQAAFLARRVEPGGSPRFGGTGPPDGGVEQHALGVERLAPPEQADRAEQAAEGPAGGARKERGGRTNVRSGHDHCVPP
jgi:hypothetical protein